MVLLDNLIELSERKRSSNNGNGNTPSSSTSTHSRPPQYQQRFIQTTDDQDYDTVATDTFTLKIKRTTFWIDKEQVKSIDPSRLEMIIEKSTKRIWFAFEGSNFLLPRFVKGVSTPQLVPYLDNTLEFASSHRSPFFNWTIPTKSVGETMWYICKRYKDYVGYGAHGNKSPIGIYVANDNNDVHTVVGGTTTATATAMRMMRMMMMKKSGKSGKSGKSEKKGKRGGDVDGGEVEEVVVVGGGGDETEEGELFRKRNGLTEAVSEITEEGAAEHPTTASTITELRTAHLYSPGLPIVDKRLTAKAYVVGNGTYIFTGLPPKHDALLWKDYNDDLHNPYMQIIDSILIDEREAIVGEMIDGNEAAVYKSWRPTHMQHAQEQEQQELQNRRKKVLGGGEGGEENVDVADGVDSVVIPSKSDVINYNSLIMTKTIANEQLEEMEAKAFIAFATLENTTNPKTNLRVLRDAIKWINSRDGGDKRWRRIVIHCSSSSKDDDKKEIERLYKNEPTMSCFKFIEVVNGKYYIFDSKC